MKTRLVQFVLALGLVVVLNPSVVQAAPEDQGVSASTSWLALMDANKVEQAWDASAGALKTAGPKTAVVPKLRQVRDQVGKVVSRKLSTKKLVHNLPGAPAGDYVVIQYNTKFAKKGDAVETVATMKEKDSKWRVAGYFIK